MEACFDRHDARTRRLQRIDPAGPNANQFTMARLIVRSNFRFRIDCRNALDVGIDWPAFRTDFTKLDSRPPGNTNTRSRS